MQSTQLAATIGGVALLLALESGAEALLKTSAQNKRALSLLGGVGLYAVVGLAFGMLLRVNSNLTLMNALWQTGNLVVVTLIGVLVFGESLTVVQWIGVALAILASICFVI